MKLSLKYFLIACLLLGAVGVPWGWRKWQHSKSIKQARLRGQITFYRWAWQDAWDYEHYARTAYFGDGLPQWQSRVDFIAEHLEKLTGERPKKPPPRSNVLGGPF